MIMYIQPNTTVQLMKNVPLNDRQTDTYWFSSEANQYAFFSSFVGSGMTFNNQMYQRVNRTYLKLDVNPELLHEYNYMRFQNTSYGDKWFYAFILDSDYINDNTAIIHYKIDPMQTWFFEYSNNMRQCFVEREHTLRDVAGDNLEPEPVTFGDYYIMDYKPAYIFRNEDGTDDMWLMLVEGYIDDIIPEEGE